MLSPSGPGPALSATSTVDARIRLDWEAGTRHGRQVIQGYVYNDYLRATSNVQLLVETLDGSGVVSARIVGFERGVVAFKRPGAATGSASRGSTGRTAAGVAVACDLHLYATEASHPAFARGGGAALLRLPLRVLTHCRRLEQVLISIL